MKARDSLTLDMFVEVPTPRVAVPGALDIGSQFRHFLSEAIKYSPLSRHQIAARMSELVGHDITKHQLDSWTAESRDGWRFPLEYLPALEVALDTHEVLAWLATIRGAKLSVGREALESQLGKLGHMKDALRKQEQAIKKLLGEQA